MDLVIKPHVFVPINDPVGYVDNLRASGQETNEDVLAEILEKHKSKLPVVNKPTTKDSEFVIHGNPNAAAAKYYARGEFPPIGVRLKCAALRGVPRENLLKALSQHERDIKNSEKDQKLLDSIFDKYLGLKPKKLKPVIKHMPVF
jgi:hypothetical protein